VKPLLDTYQEKNASHFLLNATVQNVHEIQASAFAQSYSCRIGSKGFLPDSIYVSFHGQGSMQFRGLQSKTCPNQYDYWAWESFFV